MPRGVDPAGGHFGLLGGGLLRGRSLRRLFGGFGTKCHCGGHLDDEVGS